MHYVTHFGMRMSEVEDSHLEDLDLPGKRLKERFVYISQAAVDAVQTYRAVRGTEHPLPDTLFVYRHKSFNSRY